MTANAAYLDCVAQFEVTVCHAAVTNTCRDEITRPLAARIDSIYGASFDVAGLGGVLTCGVTGLKAGLSHCPVDVRSASLHTPVPWSPACPAAPVLLTGALRTHPDLQQAFGHVMCLCSSQLPDACPTPPCILPICLVRSEPCRSHPIVYALLHGQCDP